MRIAHISDLHVSSGYFAPEWADKMIDEIHRRSVDLVVITGDLTMDGHPHEYDMAVGLLDRLKPEKFVVPGNHDSMNGGYEIFEEIFGTRKPFFENDEVALIGMDSSEPDIHDGQIGRHNYPIIKEKLKKDKVRILALHHHVIPIPKTGREFNILSDSGDILKLCVDLKLDLVLSGHRHLPWIWELQDTHFVTAGTACTRRLKGRSYPSYNMIEIDRDRIVLEQINVLTDQIEKRIEKNRNILPGSI